MTGEQEALVLKMLSSWHQQPGIVTDASVGNKTAIKCTYCGVEGERAQPASISHRDDCPITHSKKLALLQAPEQTESEQVQSTAHQRKRHQEGYDTYPDQPQDERNQTESPYGEDSTQ
jgi:hypothetical protein